MSEDIKAEPIPALAEHWARKGAAEVEKMDATINLARQLLVRGEVETYSEGENPFDAPPYPWQVSESPTDLQRRIFRGTVSDLATGSGHTIYYAAGVARDENEFRRQLAAHIGHVLANGAKVNRGLGEVPFSKTFISPSLRKVLQKLDEGQNVPAAFFYLAQWHENRS